MCYFGADLLSNIAVGGKTSLSVSLFGKFIQTFCFREQLYKQNMTWLFLQAAFCYFGADTSSDMTVVHGAGLLL